MAFAAQVHAQAVSCANGGLATDRTLGRFEKRYNTLASIYEELVLLDPSVQPDARRLPWILWNLRELATLDGAAPDVVKAATRADQDARFTSAPLR